MEKQQYKKSALKYDKNKNYPDLVSKYPLWLKITSWCIAVGLVVVIVMGIISTIKFFTN